MWVVAGLGNPGDEYAHTRHNTGRMIVEQFATRRGFSDWKDDKTLGAHVSKGSIGKESVTLLLPDTFMNKSGAAVHSVVKTAAQAERLVVVYDELDLPLGTIRLAFGRGSGGHRGVESIARSLRTENFVRVRVGICPTTPKEKLKKPRGGEQVLNFIMQPLSKKEQETFENVSKTVGEAIATIIEEGRVAAMNRFN